MRISVVGAGGVGGYFGSMLGRAGHDVSFVARGEHLAAIQERGLTVHSAGQTWTTAVAADTRILGPTPDLVIVAVKARDTEDVAREISAHLKDETVVLSLQNGVSARQVLGAHMNESHLVGGATYISAFITGPGEVTHHGSLQRIVLGEYPSSRAGSAKEVATTLAAAGVDVDLSNDITRVLWEKYVFLVGLSATTSLTRAPIGVVRGNQRSRRLLHSVMDEVVALGRASGVSLPRDLADERLRFCDTLPFEMTSSMANDLERGKPLELSWLSGNVAAMAALQQVPTPVNDVVACALAPFEDGPPTTS